MDHVPARRKDGEEALDVIIAELMLDDRPGDIPGNVLAADEVVGAGMVEPVRLDQPDALD